METLQNLLHVREHPFKEKSTPGIAPVQTDQFTEIKNHSYSGKRAFDIIFGSLVYVIYTFLFPIIAVGIKLTSPGPVIFRQKRTGMHGEIFYCYKFRTMHMVSKKTKNGMPVITEKGDRRIFSFGQFLRKTNLDELPQVVNVLEGHMSFVGPRPYPVAEDGYWNSVFDDHYYRYSIKPGITGFAQVKGYRGGTLKKESMRKRLDYDLIYVEKNSIKMDVQIVAKTATQMVLSQTNGH